LFSHVLAWPSDSIYLANHNISNAINLINCLKLKKKIAKFSSKQIIQITPSINNIDQLIWANRKTFFTQNLTTALRILLYIKNAILQAVEQEKRSKRAQLLPWC